MALAAIGTKLLGIAADYAVAKLKEFASKPADDNSDETSSASSPQGATGGQDAGSEKQIPKAGGSTRHKGNLITNDTPRAAEIRITGNNDTVTERVLPERSVRVGTGDGSDRMTVRLLSKRKKRPKHLAAKNKPLEKGEEYMITWNERKKSAGIVLKKRGSSKLYYSVRGDKKFRQLTMSDSDAMNEQF